LVLEIAVDVETIDLQGVLNQDVVEVVEEVVAAVKATRDNLQKEALLPKEKVLVENMINLVYLLYAFFNSNALLIFIDFITTV
jgi:hypothetical protein